MFYLVISALIISGGHADGYASNSAEVYIPSTGQHCQLPDMPGGKRDYPTMELMTVCGGGYWTLDIGSRTSCLTLINGVWETSTTLLEER